MVQEPHVLVLAVLLERHCEGVGNVHLSPVAGTEEDTDDALLRVFGYSVVVIDLRRRGGEE